MIRLGLCAALVLCAAPPMSAWAGQATQQKAEQESRDARLAAAVKAVGDGKATEAVALLDPLLDDYAKLYAGEKRTIYCAHDPQQAIYYMGLAAAAKQEAIAIDQGWCTALWARGFASIDLQKLDAAVPFLERAVALSPAHPHYLSELGYAYQAQKKWQLSYDLYARAATHAETQEGERRKKSLRRAWFGMGFDLIELGKLDEAQKMFERCLELYPDDAKIQSELQYIRDQRAKKS